MKKLITTIALAALACLANAAVTLVPNGDFSAGGTNWSQIGAGTTWDYQATGGNPDGYGIMDCPSGWGIWVANSNAPVSLAALGLTAGQTYTFVQDMKIISGTSIGGLKLEWWNAGYISDTGDMRPASGSGTWTTYSFTRTIPANATGIKFVPLWGPSSVVGYDNIGVVTSLPLSVAITSPTNSQVVYSNFTINATASVLPGSVTNVVFYDGASSLGNDTNSPFSYDVVGLAAGAHALKAVAWDNAGNTATSSVVNVTVTNAPIPAYAPVYEPFNYSVGNLVNNTPGTGAGETGNWVIPTGVPTIISPGLTYPGLPTANNAYQHTATGNQNYIGLATSSQLSSGTKYISYLMKGSGNSGGDTVGVYFKGNNATSLFAGFRAPNSASLTGFSLGSVNSATLGGAAGLGSTINISNNTVHLIVIKIDFNTSGANDTISLWIDPPASTNAPGVAANSIVTTFDVGTISAIGINITGGYAAQFDEFRTGNSYGDVAGAPSPTVPTTLALSIASGTQISWSASSANYYQPQSSPDNSTWTDLGGQLVGSTVTSVYDPTPAAYYQVLEDTPVVYDAVQNGGFETDDGGTGALSWSGVQSQPPTRITTDFHTGTACMALVVTNETAGANGAEIQQNVVNQGGSITPGNTYVLSFWAKQISIGVSYVQNYKITWLDGVTEISSVGFTPFTGGTGSWTQISTGPIVAPTNATTAFIQIFGATGAVLGGYGEVWIDDVSLTTTSPSGSPSVIPATVQSGAVFTATVKTNGVTATAATGTVAFKTNSVALSTGTVSAGSASSTPTALPASYSITAIYSGDTTYIGSSTTLVVGASGPSGPASLTNSVSGGVLSLSWPSGLGWRLQMQTNSLATGLGTNWIYLTDGSLSSTNIPVDGTKPTVFYRLMYP